MKHKLIIDTEARNEEPLLRQISQRREQLRKGSYHIKPCPSLDDYDAQFDRRAAPRHPRKR